MIGNNITIIVVFILYLLMMLVIGIVAFKRTSNTADYYLGGRSLGKWVVSISAQASDMSGWLLMGLPGAAYLSGLEAGWIGVGLAIGTYLNWKFVAKKLRNYTEVCGNSITIPGFLGNRYRDEQHIIRLVSALFILIFFLVYTASGFVSGAKLFSTVFNLNYNVALLIAVLEKRAGMNLGNQDVYLNVVGGLKINEPSIDLGICLVTISSFKNISIPKDMVIMGEVGLTGEVRRINFIEKRIKEAEKLGFKTCVIPESNKKDLKDDYKLDIISVRNINEAIKKVGLK